MRVRIERGVHRPAADYIDMRAERATAGAAMDARMAELDALVLPTTPIVAPTIAEVADADEFWPQEHAAAAQHLDPVNFFDLCAISLPAAAAERALPVGLMLVGAQRPGPAPVRHRRCDRASRFEG